MSQQEVIRCLMKILELTRDQFCARYNIERRALDSWLLKCESNGFRSTPGELLRNFADELTLNLSQKKSLNYMAISDYSPDDVENLVSLQVGDEIITFPPIFHHHYVLKDFEIIRDEKGIEHIGKTLDDEFTQDSVKFHRVTPNEDANLVSHEITKVEKGIYINNEPMWIYVHHFKNLSMVNGYLQALSIADPSIHNHGIVMFHGEQFVVYVRKADRDNYFPKTTYISLFSTPEDIDEVSISFDESGNEIEDCRLDNAF